MADIKIIKTSLVTNVLTSSFILLLQLIIFVNRQLINTLLHTNKHMYTMKYSNTKYIEHIFFCFHAPLKAVCICNLEQKKVKSA